MSFNNHSNNYFINDKETDNRINYLISTYHLSDEMIHSFSAAQLNSILDAIFDPAKGLSYTDIKPFLDPRISSEDMAHAFQAISLGFPQAWATQIKYDQLSLNSAKLFSRAYSLHLTYQEAAFLLSNCFSDNKKAFFLDCIEQGISYSKVLLLTDNSLPLYCLNLVKVGYDLGLSREDVSLLARSDLSEQQMKFILFALAEGMPHDMVSVFAKPELNIRQMAEAYKGLSAGIKPVNVASYLIPDMPSRQMAQLRISMSSNWSYWQRRELKKAFKDGLSVSEIDHLTRHGSSAFQMRGIRRHLLKDSSVVPDPFSARNIDICISQHLFAARGNHKPFTNYGRPAGRVSLSFDKWIKGERETNRSLNKSPNQGSFRAREQLNER